MSIKQAPDIQWLLHVDVLGTDLAILKFWYWNENSWIYNVFAVYSVMVLNVHAFNDNINVLTSTDTGANSLGPGENDCSFKNKTFKKKFVRLHYTQWIKTKNGINALALNAIKLK